MLSIWIFIIFKNIWIKYGKPLMDTAKKTGIDPAKIACKKIFQKTEI